MPLTPKYTAILGKFVEKYDKKEGTSAFWNWVNGMGIKSEVGSLETSISLEGKSLSFTTDQINPSVIEGKAGKTYYLTGYISTSDKDRVNDIVTPECLDDMVKQLISQKIKVDVEHEALKGSPNIIPIGLIEEARRDEKGIWVKVRLNSSVSRFKEVWDSIKNGFLDSFSITYKAINAVEKETADGTIRLLRLVELVNVAITGIPANVGAKIMDAFAKSLESTNQKEPTMAEDEKIEKTEEETQTTPEKTEAKSEEKTEEKTEVQVVEGKDIEGAIKGVQSLELSVKSLAEKMGKDGEFEVSMKSFIDGAIAKSVEPLSKKIAELEAKMADPVFKAKAGTTDKDIQAKEKAQEGLTSMLAQIQ